jgi:hypothetical protein
VISGERHTWSKKNLPAPLLGSQVILNLKRPEKVASPRSRKSPADPRSQSRSSSCGEASGRRGDVQQRSAERFPTFATSLTPTGSPANVRSSLTIWYGTRVNRMRRLSHFRFCRQHPPSLRGLTDGRCWRPEGPIRVSTSDAHDSSFSGRVRSVQIHSSAAFIPRGCRIEPFTVDLAPPGPSRGRPWSSGGVPFCRACLRAGHPVMMTARRL